MFINATADVAAWRRTSGPLSATRGSGIYTITQLLPPEGDDFQYKIKSAAEPHGRVAKESRLHRATQFWLKLMTFDYAASAELFMPKRQRGARQPLRYRRFASAAEAIRFAVEEFPAVRTLGAWMKVGDERFNGDDTRRLYESTSYQRHPAEITVNP